MSKIPTFRPALPIPVPPAGENTADLIPLAAELVGCVRDYGPDDVAAVLARVPEGQLPAFAVLLAAMVDPDARPSQLLAWATLGPVPSREFTPHALRIATVGAAEQHAQRRARIARLTADGLGPTEIAEQLGLSKRCVVRHRTELRRDTEAA